MIKNHDTKSIITIALPLMAAFLAQRGMQLIDTVMMGWIGPTALAAGAFGVSIFGIIALFCMGVLSAVGVFIVREKGADHAEEVRLIMQQGFFLSFLLSAPGMIILWNIPHILLMIGEDPQVVVDTTLLLHGMSWGFPGFLLFFVLREFISAFSLTLIVMIVSLISIPLTWIVNYVLLYGKYHFPALGIAGIGYGGSIVMWFMFFSLLVYSKKHPVLKRHIALTSFAFDRNRFNDMLYIGLPVGGVYLLEAGMFLSTIIMMGSFGVAALAGHQIALQWVNIVYTFPVALSMATTLRVGHAVGGGDLAKAKNTALFSFFIVILISAIIAIIFIAASDSLTTLFLESRLSDDKNVYQFATSFLDIAAIFLCFDAMQSVVNGALRGLRDTFVPMLLSMGCYWVLGVGGAYYLSQHTQLGADGIWYGLCLGLSSAAIILVWRFFRKLNVEINKSIILEKAI